MSLITELQAIADKFSDKMIANAESTLTKDEFLAIVDSGSNSEESVNATYEYCLSLLRDNREALDELLLEVDVEKGSPVVLISMLTVCRWAKPRLTNHTELYNKVLARASSAKGDKYAKESLEGLE